MRQEQAINVLRERIPNGLPAHAESLLSPEDIVTRAFLPLQHIFQTLYDEYDTQTALSLQTTTAEYDATLPPVCRSRVYNARFRVTIARFIKAGQPHPEYLKMRQYQRNLASSPQAYTVARWLESNTDVAKRTINDLLKYVEIQARADTSTELQTMGSAEYSTVLRSMGRHAYGDQTREQISHILQQLKAITERLHTLEGTSLLFLPEGMWLKRCNESGTNLQLYS